MLRALFELGGGGNDGNDDDDDDVHVAAWHSLAAALASVH